jgi:hypothetical protein
LNIRRECSDCFECSLKKLGHPRHIRSFRAWMNTVAE